MGNPWQNYRVSLLFKAASFIYLFSYYKNRTRICIILAFCSWHNFPVVDLSFGFHERLAHILVWLCTCVLSSVRDMLVLSLEFFWWNETRCRTSEQTANATAAFPVPLRPRLKQKVLYFWCRISAAFRFPLLICFNYVKCIAYIHSGLYRLLLTATFLLSTTWSFCLYRASVCEAPSKRVILGSSPVFLSVCEFVSVCLKYLVLCVQTVNYIFEILSPPSF